MAKASEVHSRNGCSIIREKERKKEDYDDDEGKDEEELLIKQKNLIC
jgi:hypothetical protein